ncbi:MAG TPA: M15 family metallopeptidase, partial [Pyrinomonadaceae bacterium]|nr:M15 family metallopeptidase [Pyrinomonadaceae bacterium]
AAVTPPQPGAVAAASPVSAIITTDSAAFAAMDKRGKSKKLNPVFRERLVLLAEALAQRGMQTLITDGLRTFAEQDALFLIGRRGIPGEKIVTKARGGQSNHNYGLAVDMFPVINGKVFTDVKKTDSVEFRKLFHAIQDAAGEEAERLGLFWGARFSGIVDTPHIQLLPESVLKPSECLKIFKKNGDSLAAVWAEAEKHVKPLKA